MAKDRVIVGIDIGSSKICTIISTIDEDQIPHIIGVSSTPSRGIRKGQIIDIEESVGAVTKSIEAAERMAGFSAGSAFVLIGGTHIECQNSKGVVAISSSSSEVDHADINRVIEAARAVSLPSSREVLHVIPRHFSIDSQTGIKDPVGMTGVRLEVETHLITGATTAIRNLGKCVQTVGVGVESMVFSGLAAAEAVLSDTEKELGVIVVDIGGGTTDVVIYVDGAVAYSAVLPVGAKNITNDIAIGQRISLESAEKIKLHLSKPSALKFLKPQSEKPTHKKDDYLDLSSLRLDEPVEKASFKMLTDGFIKPRVNEILKMIKDEIKKSGFGSLTPAGVVLTGGGAQTIGIVDHAKRELGMPVRLGKPQSAKGLIDEISTPEFAASLGLILFALKTDTYEDSRMPIVGRVEIKESVTKAVNWVKSLLP